MSDPDPSQPSPPVSPAASGGEAPALGVLAATLRDPATWAEPPTDLPARVEAEIAQGEHGPAGSEEPARRRHWTRPLLAAAAVALLTLGMVAGRLSPNSRGPADGRTVATFELAATGPDARLSASGPVIDRGVGIVYRLAQTSLPPAAPGDHYEGWVESLAGERVSIGTFHMRGTGSVSLWSGVDVTAFPIVVITDSSGQELLRGTITAQ